VAAEPALINLPDMGDAAGSIMSAEEERQLGQEFMRTVRQSLHLEEDPACTEYLQNLGERLISHVNGYDGDITLFIVDDPSINAFAGPGGFIGVHTGLILASQSEGELASVLAHEIAHITQRHLLRSFEADSKMGLPTLAAIIAAIVAGGSNPEVSQAVIASTMANSAQQHLTYSRLYEQEADRVGIGLLAKADYDPRTMVSFFEKLQQKNRYLDNRLPEFLLTHPLTFSRVADARNRAEQYPKKRAFEDNTSFYLFQARIASLTRGIKNTTNEQIIQPRVVADYRQALQYQANGEHEKAHRLLLQLQQNDPSRLFYHINLAENAIAANKLAQAEALLKKALALFPENRPLTLLLAETLIFQRKMEEAYERLTRHIQSTTPYPQTYEKYAQVAQAVGRPAEAFQALAEAERLRGNLHQAIDYLEQALQERRIDRYQRLALEARLREIKQQQRQIDQNQNQSVTE
jgi:predicted Zn-dependent protease